MAEGIDSVLPGQKFSVRQCDRPFVAEMKEQIFSVKGQIAGIDGKPEKRTNAVKYPFRFPVDRDANLEESRKNHSESRSCREEINHAKSIVENFPFMRLFDDFSLCDQIDDCEIILENICVVCRRLRFARHSTLAVDDENDVSLQVRP